MVELGADTKALNIKKQRPSELAIALGKPELALAIDAQKQQKKLAGVMQPLNEQISLLQEENKLLRQCLAAIASGMPSATGNIEALSKYLTQSFSQFGENSINLKPQAFSSNSYTNPTTNTTSSFFQPVPKQNITPVANDNYSCDAIERLLNHIKQDYKDVEVASILVDVSKNPQLFKDAITDFMKKRSLAIKSQQGNAKRLIIPLCIDNHFVSVCVAFENKQLSETPAITYIDPKGEALSPVMSNILESLFPQAKLLKIYEKAQTTDNNNAPWMIETILSLLANSPAPSSAFDVQNAKQEQKKILNQIASMKKGQ